MLTDFNAYCLEVPLLMVAYKAPHDRPCPPFPLALRPSPPALLLTCGGGGLGEGRGAAVLASLLFQAHSRHASALLSDRTVP